MNTTNSKQQKLRTPRYKLLPYATIQAATQGDPDAIAAYSGSQRQLVRS